MFKIVLIVVTISACLYSKSSENERVVRNLKIDKIHYKVYESANSLENDNMNRQVYIIKNIKDACQPFNKIKDAEIKSGNDSVVVTYNKRTKLTSYRNLNQYGISVVEFGNDNIPRSCLFKSSPSRNFTQAEDEMYAKTKKIPQSYKKINEDKAIEQGRALINTIYGVEEGNKFDSVKVSYNNKDFILFYCVKIKNDIWDSRSIEIAINANTGEIQRYSGGRSSDIDFSYVPKISKENARQVYAVEIKKLNADIEINQIALSKRKDSKGKYRWLWRIYGTRKDKKIGTSAMMFIDSETGEIVFKKMD